MNKWKTFGLLLVVFALFWAGDLPNKKHLGLWKGQDGKDTAYFHFHPDRYFSMIFGNDTLDGHSVIWDNQEEMCVRHLTNYSKDPHEIDIVIYFKDKMLEVSRSKGIFRFDSIGRMHLNIDLNERRRPKKFTNRRTIIFTKVK